MCSKGVVGWMLGGLGWGWHGMAWDDVGVDWVGIGLSWVRYRWIGLAGGGGGAEWRRGGIGLGSRRVGMRWR